MIGVLRVPNCRFWHNICIMRCCCSRYRLQRSINVSCSATLHLTISMSHSSITDSHTHARGVCAIALVPGSSLSSNFAIRVAESGTCLSVWHLGGMKLGGAGLGLKWRWESRRKAQKIWSRARAWRQIATEGLSLRSSVWENISCTCCSNWVSAERLKGQDWRSPPRPCETMGSVAWVWPWDWWVAMMVEVGSSVSLWVVLSYVEGGLNGELG